MDDEHQTLDLRVAEDCRKLLSSIKVNGRLVTNLTIATGETIDIAELSDTQAIQYANQLHKDLFQSKTVFDSHLWDAQNHA